MKFPLIKLCPKKKNTCTLKSIHSAMAEKKIKLKQKICKTFLPPETYILCLVDYAHNYYYYYY